MKRYVIAITGATGSAIGIRVIGELLKEAEVHLIVSSGSFFIIQSETGMDWNAADANKVQAKIRRHFSTRRLFYWEGHNMAAPVSSGSFRTDGMLVVPCSMKTLSGIASGYANTLVERAADVTIKEGRMLLLSPREMPLSAIHLENMLKLARIGVKIAPPVAGFYHNPQSLDDMVDFFAGKILDAVGIQHTLFTRWESSAPGWKEDK
ncbi:MAG: UbiX family flavin prenyltransferase [Thermodesulfovibrionales bacterium]|nr:UbiX family flavin prenyltransferase [Thermodesulfovibrionales bacterium]